MVRIIDGRGTGKTYKLLMAAHDQGATVVCSNPHAFSDKALRYGIYGLKFLSYNEFLEGGNAVDEKIMIDELEAFLTYMCQYNPACQFVGYTLSNED